MKLPILCRHSTESRKMEISTVIPLYYTTAAFLNEVLKHVSGTFFRGTK